MDEIRKVVLTMDEEIKDTEVIKKLLDTNGNKENSCIENRMFRPTHQSLDKRLQREWKDFFHTHGNRGRKPTIALQEDTRQKGYWIYNILKYYDCNLTHYSELLEKKISGYL